MSAKWPGPYMRFALNDDGLSVRSGTLSQSPDIIPAGTADVNPADYIDKLWTKDLGSSTTADVYNRLYVRGENGSDQATEARLYLYYSPSRLLQWPDRLDNGDEGWAHRPLKTGSENAYQVIEIKGKAKFVTPTPFIWKPKQLPNDHYCLISRVSTDKRPNEVPTGLNSIDDFTRYICEHPDVAWRNVYTLAPEFNVWSEAPLYQQGEQGSEMVVTLWIRNGRVGDTVTVRSPEKGPEPGINWSYVVKEPTKDELTRRTYIPAGWKSGIEISYFSAKGPVPENLGMELSTLKVTDVNHSLARYARPLRDLGIRGLNDLTALAIPVGATTYSSSVATPF